MDKMNDKSKKNDEESNDDAEKSSPETKLIELEGQVEQLKDKLLRKAAEFDNYKRRTESEMSSLIKYSNERLILEILPILDDYDRMNTAWDEKHDIESLKQGSDLILEKLRKSLSKYGLEEIDAVGKKFDFNLHDAVMQMPRTDVEPETIVTEVEKGYKLNDKVIRHSKVVVSSPATGD